MTQTITYTFDPRQAWPNVRYPTAPDDTRRDSREVKRRTKTYNGRRPYKGHKRHKPDIQKNLIDALQMQGVL